MSRVSQNNNNNPNRRDTVGLDSPRDSSHEEHDYNLFNGDNNTNNRSRSSSSRTEFHVVSRRVVDACADLKVSLHRRLDIEHINDRFDEARNRTILNSNPHFTDSTSGSTRESDSNNRNSNINFHLGITRGAGGGADFSDPSNVRQNAKSATKFGEEPEFDQVTGGVNHKSIGRKLARLQYARNVLITNASPTVTKELFKEVPEEWLRVFRDIATLLVYTVCLLVIPISALELDCSSVQCVSNNVTSPTNSTRRIPRKTYLHAFVGDDCPFSQWSNALFGVWFGVASAAAFGAVVFIWTVADTFFAPFHSHFKSITNRTIVATISTVPFRIRLFVVVPPLIGMGITGSMIYARLKAQAENVTWSWGTIAAPAIVGYGLALLLKLWISWKYLNKQNAGGNTARNILPANWAKLLLILNALAMTVAALVSPSVAAKMADCDLDYGPHWDAVIFPMLVFFGVKLLTSISELLYRVVNGAASASNDRYGIGDGGGGSSSTAASTNAEEDDDDDNDDAGSLNSVTRRDHDDDDANGKGSHAVRFGNDNRPVWQDCLRLLCREALVTAGMVMVMLKLHDRHDYGFIAWIYIALPFIISAGIGFIVSILEVKASIRYAKEQFCSLEELLGDAAKAAGGGNGQRGGSAEESLGTFYGATSGNFDHNNEV